MKILQLTVHFPPNIGGVETHLSDLINALIKKGWQLFVLSYQPLSTKMEWKAFEKNKNLTILRIPWISGFFEKLVSYPIAEFIYLVPGLFVVTPFVILSFRPNVIHAHGLIAAVSAVFWGKLFSVKVVISLHSFYSFPKIGLYHDFVRLLLQTSDFTLSLSRKSNEEVKELGIEDKKTGVFTYWIDLEKFKRMSKARENLNWKAKFIVLFVGRLIKEKGIDVLLESAKLWHEQIKLVIIGSGLLEEDILAAQKKTTALNFIGRIDQNDLPLYYSAADLTVVPSIYEEGFGRVIIESLACGTPVVASKKGAIPEVMDETVGKFIKATPEGIREAVEYFYKNPIELRKLSQNAREFVGRRYYESNVEDIVKTYTN